MLLQQPLSTEADVSSHKRWRWWIGGVVVALIAIAVAMRLIHSGTEQRSGAANRNGRTGPMPVNVAQAASKTFDVYVNALGTVTPLGTVTVHSRVDGELMKVAFKEGQLVKPGDLLAEIDPRPYQVQLTQANGQMARDQALLKNAEVDLERYRTLLEQDSASKQQVDTQEALVRQYKAALEVDQGQIDSAKLQLTYAHVTAPIAGRLGLRQVDQGNMVHASDPNGLVVITQLNPITAIFTIAEDELPMVARRYQSGEELPVAAWDRSASRQLAEGMLTTFDNQVDPATGTVKLKAQFQNDAATLFPNQFVNIKLRVDQMHDATVVPVAAIQRGQRGTFVYVVNTDHTVAMRTVEVGPSQVDSIVIKKGLQPGETVVLDGADKLREGAKIEPVTAQDRAAAEAAQDKQQTGKQQTGKKGEAGNGKRRRRDQQGGT